MSGELDGTRVFITGGGSGLGHRSALAPAGQCCFVTVAGWHPGSPDETVCLVGEASGDGAVVLCDVVFTDAADHHRGQQ